MDAKSLLIPFCVLTTVNSVPARSLARTIVLFASKPAIWSVPSSEALSALMRGALAVPIVALRIASASWVKAPATTSWDEAPTEVVAFVRVW
ncbi:hypothetical protein D3C72_1668470 [compost metagenome]